MAPLDVLKVHIEREDLDRIIDRAGLVPNKALRDQARVLLVEHLGRVARGVDPGIFGKGLIRYQKTRDQVKAVLEMEGRTGREINALMKNKTNAQLKDLLK